jgi:hypothetical protein
MVLKRAYCPFCCINAMVVRFDELVLGSMCQNGPLYGRRRFIVHDVQGGLSAMLGELLVQMFVRTEGFSVATIFHWIAENRIAVVVIDNE